jgi:hypothetical protein
VSAAAAHEPNRAYRDVLRNRHVAGLLLGDLLASAGTGMIIVAMPVQTLSIHGNVPSAIAIGLVEAAPFLLSTVLALAWPRPWRAGQAGSPSTACWGSTPPSRSTSWARFWAA